MTLRRRAPGRPPGGSDAIVEKILHETAKQLGAGGLEALSVEEVARAAGVNKTTVYRRWPTRARLVVAAIHALREKSTPFSPSGDLRRDLVALLSAKAKNMSTPRGRKIARALMALGETNREEVAEALRDVDHATPVSLLAEAVAAGELGKSTDVQLAGELLSAAIVHRLMVLGQPVDRAFVERVVDHVVEPLRKKQR